MSRSVGLAFHLRQAWFAWTVLLSLAWVWAGAVGMPGAFAPKGTAGVAAITATAESATLAKSAQTQRPAEARTGPDPDLALVPAGNRGIEVHIGSPATRRPVAGLLATHHQRPQPRAPPLA